ncbi:MAG: site-2 protease family protein [Chloroflexi bacterium]|nr:MAG: site-2 protease family protein [Chloroflexota bacterium]
MIFNLELLADDPVAFFVLFSALGTAVLLGLVLHEASHALAADRLGDRLPRASGRLTLNPLAHLDRTGTLLIALVGFGWAKPVPVNPNATKNPKSALAITAFAGPATNFIIAAVASVPFRLGSLEWFSLYRAQNTGSWGVDEYAGYYLSTIVLISVILGIFNLIPIAPLDGFKVAIGILPRELSRSVARLERFGPVLLISLIALPFLTGGRVSLLADVMRPVIGTLTEFFTGVDGRI